MLLGLQTVPFVTITDHRALEYFTTKQLLNPRQARWADIVADYNFKITYRPGTANIVADALTRKHNELITQKEKDIAARTQVFLDPSCVIASLEGILNVTKEGLKVATDQFESPYQLINQILQANRSHKSLELYRRLAEKSERGWNLQEGLLTRFDRLMVPDIDAVRTYLINKAHSTPIMAHLGKTKTAKLLSAQYYWPGIPNDCATGVQPRFPKAEIRRNPTTNYTSHMI